MKKVIVLGALGALALLAVAFSGNVAAGTPAPARDFEATLSGDQEVPPVTTDGTGDASFTIAEDEMSIDFTLFATGLNPITQGHIHLGARGVNGPVVVFLVDARADPIVNGEVDVFGTITADDLIGPLEGMPLSALIAQMRAGNTYTNVHTTVNPGGEVRGHNEEAAPILAR